MKPLLIAAVASCSFWAGMAAATTLTGQVVDATVRHGIGSSAYESECQTYQNLGVAIGAGVEVGPPTTRMLVPAAEELRPISTAPRIS